MFQKFSNTIRIFIIYYYIYTNVKIYFKTNTQSDILFFKAKTTQRVSFFLRFDVLLAIYNFVEIT